MAPLTIGELLRRHRLEGFPKFASAGFDDFETLLVQMNATYPHPSQTPAD